MGKGKSKLELQYSIEALEDHIEHLEEVIADCKAKHWETICENDRLTLTYEPFRPPGDEHEGLDFYGLIEENDELTQNVLDKMEVIKELEEEVNSLRVAIMCTRPAPTIPTVKRERLIKNDRYWNVTFELWPGAWGLSWYRFDWRRTNSKSREGSFQLGPLGFSWNRDPKRR